MANINLAPGTQFVALARKRRRRLFLVSFVLLVLLGGVWLGLVAFKGQAEAAQTQVEARLNTVQTEIAKLGSEVTRVELFEDRLVELDALLDAHLEWGTLFEELQRLLPPPTVINAATINADSGELNLTGVTPDIDTVAQTLTSLSSGPNHETLFTLKKFDSVAREAESSPAENIPAPPATYTFSAEFTFDNNELRVSQSE